MRMIALLLAGSVVLFVTFAAVSSFSTKPETVIQRIDRVCGQDTDCKLRQEIRVIETRQAAVEHDQDTQVGN